MCIPIGKSMIRGLFEQYILYIVEHTLTISWAVVLFIHRSWTNAICPQLVLPIHLQVDLY